MTREEINEEKQKKISWENNKDHIKRTVIKVIKIVFVLAIIITSLFFYTTYVSTSIIQVREYRYVNNKIPNNFDGLKIIHFSDLHYGSTMMEEDMKIINKKINDRKPDIIVFTGDLIDKQKKLSQKEQEKLIGYLKELDASIGKYAVMGDEDEEDIYTIYSQSDFILLKNESDLIYRVNNQPILMVGLSSFISDQQDITKGYEYFQREGSDANIFNIVLMHEPDTIEDITSNYQNTDLVLAGHSHNGYIRTPISHVPLDRKFGAKKYPNDYYKVGSTDLYVSGGLGTNSFAGFRLFCRPSINLYRLSSQ